MRRLALLVVTLVAGASCLRATPTGPGFASFIPVDECGGQPAFLGSTYIVEESNGFCGGVSNGVQYSSSGLPITGVAAVGGSIQITFASNSFTSSLQTSDYVFVSATAASPACLLSSTGVQVSSATSTTVTLNSTSCTGASPSITSGVLYGDNRVKTSPSLISRYELKLLTRQGGSWVNYTPSVTMLSTATARTNLGIASNCSLGNPGGYYDGTNWYIAFIVQNSGSCGSNNTPNKGVKYDLWACTLGSGSSPSTTLGSGNCNDILMANTSASMVGGMLDPHIFNGHIYISERDNASVLSTLGVTYNVWSVDDITMNWGTSPPSLNSIKTYVFNPANWDLPAVSRYRATDNCEQFYKLTGLWTLPSGNIRAFFQGNDINLGGQSPFQSYAMGTACDTFGAGQANDQSNFAGLFYADLTGAAYSGNVYAGTNYTQIYPNPALTHGSNSCLTPNDAALSAGDAAYCFGEFPLVFRGGTAMLTNANPVVQPHTVTDCFQVNGCRTNYAVEMGEALLSTDYSQATLPTTVMGSGSYSNMQVPGNTNCRVLMSPTDSATNCGVLAVNGGGAPTPYFGGCAHIDLDEPTGTVTCANGTNFTYMNGSTSFNFIVRRTMVFTLAQSILVPVTQATGGVAITGGASFLSQ